MSVREEDKKRRVKESAARNRADIKARIQRKTETMLRYNYLQQQRSGYDPMPDGHISWCATLADDPRACDCGKDLVVFPGA